MSDLEKLQLQEKITDLEQDFKELEELRQKESEKLQIIKSKLEFLKDLAWDKQSKKESSSMYKVLKEDKTHTMVKSEVGNIKVDKEFMEKEITKHLDNPSLRGMVTTKEMLSFPKVAKGVGADKETRGYTWQVKANDGNILVYGSRKYQLNDEKIHRLATNHSKTERNERKAEEDRRGHPYHPIFNDLNFRKSADKEIITQNKEYGVNKKDTNSETEKGQRKIEKTGRDERGQLRREFNDRDFLNSANNNIVKNNK